MKCKQESVIATLLGTGVMQIPSAPYYKEFVLAKRERKEEKILKLKLKKYICDL